MIFISAEGRKRSQITLGHSSEVSLDVQEKDIKCLNASIVAPSGLEEPCFVKKRPDGALGKFQHIISILLNVSFVSYLIFMV